MINEDKKSIKENIKFNFNRKKLREKNFQKKNDKSINNQLKKILY